MHPAIAVARAALFNLVGDFEECLLDSPDFDVDTSGLQGKLAWGGGAVRRAVGRKEASYRDILRAQPPSVVYQTFAVKTLGGLHLVGVGFQANKIPRPVFCVMRCSRIVSSYRK
jgi:hypothetical protein